MLWIYLLLQGIGVGIRRNMQYTIMHTFIATYTLIGLVSWATGMVKSDNPLLCGAPSRINQVGYIILTAW